MQTTSPAPPHSGQTKQTFSLCDGGGFCIKIPRRVRGWQQDSAPFEKKSHPSHINRGSGQMDGFAPHCQFWLLIPSGPPPSPSPSPPPTHGQTKRRVQITHNKQVKIFSVQLCPVYLWSLVLEKNSIVGENDKNKTILVN